MTKNEKAPTLDIGTLNERWAKQMIEALISQGVRTFCIAPGARSTPLTVAAASHPLARTFVHYDERGLGFYALGYAKGRGEPVALIVTSGSAVGNLLPAVMEGYHDHVPLIVLTADRPPELRDTGANQATMHTKIFQNFVQWECDLPCPDASISQSFIKTTIAQAVSQALSEPRGPVHLNCMYRKPLLNQDPPPSLSPHFQSPCPDQPHLFIGAPQIDANAYTCIAEQLHQHEKGVILVGGRALFNDSEGVYTLSRLLNWPIFPDILSPLRSQGWREGVIPYYDLLLRTIEGNQTYRPDAILQFGSRFVSAALTDWIASSTPKFYCQVAPYPQRTDPTHCVTHRITTDLDTFLKKLPSFFSKNPLDQWSRLWEAKQARIQKTIDSYFESSIGISEPHLFHYLTRLSDPSTAFFFSNSLPIRNANLFFFPKSPCGPLHGNRGLSGIDGILATIVGVAKGQGTPLIACVGDLSLLHDLNSLSLFSSDLPIKLIVINNNGGDIFSFLPISQRKDPYLFKTYFTAPHAIPFSRAAALFNIPYANPRTLADLDKALSSPDCAMIEIKTKPGENQNIHREIVTECAQRYALT